MQGMEIHERLKAARERVYKTAKMAAEVLDVPYGTYTGHESGTRGFFEEVPRYAKAFRVRAGWLAFGEEPMEPSKTIDLIQVKHAEQPQRGKLVGSYDPDEVQDEFEHEDPQTVFPAGAIKELISKGGLGSGEVVAHSYRRDIDGQTEVDAVKDEYWMFPASFVKYALGAQVSSLIAIECNGDSMEPTISPGERVWANTMHRKPTPDGLYAIRDALDEVIVKRLELIPGSPPRVRIISDNPKHTVREAGLDEVAIVGKVVCGLRLL